MLNPEPGRVQIYFIRDAIRAEFNHEAKWAKVEVREVDKNIFLAADANAPRLYWALDYWPAEKIPYTSILDAVKKLRRIGKTWSYAGGENFRRGRLIADALKVKAIGALDFPVRENATGACAFTLENKEALWISRNPLKGNFAGGKIRFREDRSGPPSRAYLKLYEALTLAGLRLGGEDQVLDLGAAPGGWSYVVLSLGAQVTMVDRSEPAKAFFKKFPRAVFVRGDGLNVSEKILHGKTFLLSDMACEPGKLLAAVDRWLGRRELRAMVCTLKFHGISDKGVIREFAAIPGSEIYHLWHNGHELTWVWSAGI